MAANASHSRILIVGAGIFGTSTAYHLAHSHADPSSITVLDRSPFPPRHAASIDISKIVSVDYATPFYMDLAFEARHAWKNMSILRDRDGELFFDQACSVMLSNEESGLVEEIRANFRAQDRDQTDDLKKSELDLWAGPQENGYLNRHGGWVDAGAALAAMMEDAVSRGVRYKTGDVETLILGENGVKGVQTKDGRVYKADKILLATGAWTSQLLSQTEGILNIGERDRVEKQVTAAGVCVVYYKLNEEEYEFLKDLPVIISGDIGEVVPPPKRSRLLKFTNARSFTNTTRTASRQQISIPPDSLQTNVPSHLQSETLDSIVSKIPQLASIASKKPYYWRLCWDGITPSQDQLITRHPHAQLSNLYLAAGGSFHSWKFLPIIGSYVVNVLNGVSNGEEKRRRGVNEKFVPKRDLKDLED
ncbi:nucleotide-binding domain-containing protein [Bimuria novae-zelandiae CBS 107.79]|uniref:Nucleotide-binding domain-containing protein n=1 Tax=Bimuria novae-zelandiae CBS 107.79 TaxID=1447943 RepID=A0A6A5V6I3_9PLEO|nr:nucleotide-binding domain-containing protein [Bimuria novae-zelandiae CBS 107.79]